jgi:alpha-beta hydrolase superfamily lysophospholipase
MVATTAGGPSLATKPRPLYLETPGGAVFGVFHEPSAVAEEGLPAVLFCAPWGWNETVSYHSRRTWAQSLAASGHPVLRFDLPAVGDSAGKPDQLGLVSSWVAAIAAAAERLAELAPGREIAVLGMELGGLLSLEAARQGAPIDALALWAVPKDGRGFVRTVKAFSRMQRWGGEPDGGSPLPEGWIEAAGFVLSAETASALGGLRPTAEDQPARLARVLVLGRDEIAPEAALVEHLGSAGAVVQADQGLGWDDLVLHPGYTVPPPGTMARLATWLAEGRREGVGACGSPPEVAENEFEGDAPWREEVLHDLPPQTFAILVTPPERSEDPGEEVVVFLNAGAVRHIGPNRVWVDSTRELVRRGVTSVRVDLAGIGETDGDSARFAEDAGFYEPAFGKQVRAILDSLERAGVGRRFVVLGLCSGGYWSFRAGLEDPRVVKTILLNPGALRWRDSLVMEQHGKGLELLVQPRLWGKLLRGGFSLRQMQAFLHLAYRRLVQRIRALSLRVRAADSGAPIERLPGVEADLDALRDAGVAAVLAFSQSEMTEDELRRFGILDDLARWPNLRAVDLPGVDHALASTSAQAAARKLILEEVAGKAETAASSS